MPISTFSSLLHSESLMEEQVMSKPDYADFGETAAAASSQAGLGSRRKRKPRIATVATMLSPSKFEPPFYEYAIEPQWMVHAHDDEEPAGEHHHPRNLSSDVLSRISPSDEGCDSDAAMPVSSIHSNDSMQHQQQRRSAWGRPRGRRTIQDKIAEQEKRAAEIEQELRSVGLPASCAVANSPSPSLSKLGKPGARKTVPMSVIRKSPAVNPQFIPAAMTLQRQPNLARTLTKDPPVIINNTPNLGGHNMMLVPSVIFRLDGLRPSDQLYIPQNMSNVIVQAAASQPSLVRNCFGAAQFYQPSSPSPPPRAPSPPEEMCPQKPYREERLSTKLKRIKAKSGAFAEESPRGFLSQKIETLKRRESCLQQEFDQVFSTPITKNGISSAQHLQRQVTVSTAEQLAQGPVLFQMLRNQAEAQRSWKKIKN